MYCAPRSWVKQSRDLYNNKFTAVIYSKLYFAKVFVTVSYFYPNIILTSNTRANHVEPLALVAVSERDANRVAYYN
jgi:hypothetical protein